MNHLMSLIDEWLKSLLVSGIMSGMNGMFDSVNTQTGNIASQVGMSPLAFSPQVYSMIRQISETVIVPIAGMILTFVACWELIQMIIDHNNLANFETWIFFKWVFKTAAAILIITNTFDIVLAVFDVAQYVVSKTGGLIQGSTAVTQDMMNGVEAKLNAMQTGELLGIFLMVLVLRLGMWIMSILIFVIIYGRMIEIYLMTSLAPIPFATLMNKEQSHIGQNYFRSLLALGFQGFLIMICVAIYAVLIQNLAVTDDILGSMWGMAGYTVLLCFTLFKTGSLSKSVFDAH